MLTQRLGENVQFNEEFIDGFIDIVKEHKHSCDEVWLASYYGYPPVEKHREGAEKLSIVADKMRFNGIRVSLQISNTLGHGEYMAVKDCSGLVYEGSPAERVINHNGEVLNYCFCYRGAYVKEYLCKVISTYVKVIKPHTIWFDDDLRLNTNNSFHCFCDNCIKQFNTTYGVNFDRETLIRESNYGDIIWRKRLIDFLRKGLHDFTYELCLAAVREKPDIYIGYQHGPYGYYTGYSLDFVFDAMRKASGKNPKSRPGGGAYSEHNPREFVYKGAYISGQVSMLPDYVEEIRPEIENLPDIPYGKSVEATCAETTIYFAYGANAMSYALMMRDYEPISWHKEMLKAFSEHRAYWQQLAELNKGSKQAGIEIFIPEDLWKYKDEKIGPYMWKFEPWDITSCWAPLGIPVAFDKNENSVYMLQYEISKKLSDEDILFLLDKPVITDGNTLEMINERFPDAINATAKPKKLLKYYEKFTSHKINKGIEDKKYKIGTFGYDGKGYEITGEDIEPFGILHTDLKDIQRKEGSCPYGVLNAVVKTLKNTKWIVFGVNPWHSVVSYDKRNQIVQAAEYIGGKLLPAVIESRIQAVVLPRIDKTGKVICVSITNITIGDSGLLRVKIRNAKTDNFKLISRFENRNIMTNKEEDGHIVVIPNLKAYQTATIMCV